MLQKEEWMFIHVLKAQGLSIRQIASKMGISRNTVSRYLRSQATPHYKPRKARPSKLEPFHEYILQRIEAAAPDIIAAPALLRELKVQGYQGQLRLLQAFMQLHKPSKSPEPIVRFETPPGQQMQCDFVVFRRGSDPLYAFTATLGYSRLRWVRFVTNEKSATLIACHHALFERLGGCRAKSSTITLKLSCLSAMPTVQTTIVGIRLCWIWLNPMALFLSYAGPIEPVPKGK